MASFPLSDILGKLKDGATRALRITGETKITNDDTSPIAMKLTGSNVDENGRLKTVVEGGTFQATLADQMAKTIDVNLQDAATATGNGTVFAVGAYKTLTFEISGTSTSRTIVFEGASASGAYYAIQGVKLQDLSMATQTTGNGEVWSFEVTGLTSFRARVSAVAGGNVTVKGKAVA